MLKWLSSKVFGGNSAPAKEGDMCIYSGDCILYKMTPSGRFAAVFNAAAVSLVRVGNWRYQLTVEKVYTGDEEQESEDDDDDVPEIITFDVEERLQAARENSPAGAPALSWQMMTADSVDRYMLQPDEETEEDNHKFFVCFCRALYENIKKATSANVAEGEILAVLRGGVDREEPVPEAAESGSGAPEGFIHAADFKIDENMKFPPLAIPGLPENTLVVAQGKLLAFNTATCDFSLVRTDVAALIHPLTAKFSYGLMVLAGNAPVVSQIIGNECYPFFSTVERSIVWSYTLRGNVWTWKFFFDVPGEDVAFKNCFARCLYETGRQEPFDKVKEEDKNIIYSQIDSNMDLDDSIMEDVDEPNEEDKMDFEDSDEEDEESEEEEEEEEEEESAPERNKLLAVSCRHNRALVVRGSQIGVFESTPYNKVKFTTRIKGIQTKGGDLFSPSQIMLHQGEDSLMMLHPDQKKTVYKMDLHRGEIVEEFKTDENYAVTQVLPKDKYAAQTDNQTFLGLNKGGMFMLDPRLNGPTKMVNSMQYFYSASTKPQLSCAASTAKGHLAVGSEKGEVRLFDKKLFVNGYKPDGQIHAPRAQTLLPGCGDPIKAIDVTANGKWILATCENYLMLIPTERPDGISGFEKPLGKNKPVPRRLQLKPEHIHRIGGEVHFTPARFDTGADNERSIVTSTGPYLISWNFRKARQNILDDYKVTMLGEDVVSGQFKFNDANAIFYATPQNFNIAKKASRK